MKDDDIQPLAPQRPQEKPDPQLELKRVKQERDTKLANEQQAQMRARQQRDRRQAQQMQKVQMRIRQQRSR
jgi:hypothetical protein